MEVGWLLLSRDTGGGKEEDVVEREKRERQEEKGGVQLRKGGLSVCL